MKRLLLSAVLVCGCLGVARADDAAVRREAAVKLLDLFGLNKTYDQTMRQAMQMPLNMIEKQQIPEAEKVKAREAVQSAMDTTLEKFSWDRMKNMFADTYAEVLTTDEINGLIAFYESPAGKAFIAKQPELTKATMARMQTVMEELMTELQDKAKAATQPAPQ